MDKTIYYILGGLVLIYLLIAMFNRKKSRQRKSRRFMDGYERRDKNKE